MVSVLSKHSVVASNTTKTVIVTFILFAGLLTYTYVFQKTTILEFDRYTGDMRQTVYVHCIGVDTQLTPSGLAQQMTTLGITPPPRKWMFLSRWNMTTRACGGSSDFSAIHSLAPVLEIYCSTVDPAIKKTFLEQFLLHATADDEIGLDIQNPQRRVHLLANGQRIGELPIDPS